MTRRNLVALLTLVVVGGIMVLVVADMPEFGTPGPQYNQLYDKFVNRVIQETGAVNAVTGIILDYRAYDTLGETTVLLVAIMGTMAALGAGAVRLEAGSAVSRPVDSRILDLALRVVIPFTQVFGLFVIFNGHLSPGGGFAGGTIIGASLILKALVSNYRQDRRAEFRSEVLESASVAWYLLMGLVGLLAGHAFLSNAGVFPLGSPGMPLSSGMILIVSMGVGAKVASTMQTLFLGLVHGGILHEGEADR
jgi:multicomponent Na+:H+ antiporter subunit B